MLGKLIYEASWWQAYGVGRKFFEILLGSSLLFFPDDPFITWTPNLGYLQKDDLLDRSWRHIPYRKKKETGEFYNLQLRPFSVIINYSIFFVSLLYIVNLKNDGHVPPLFKALPFDFIYSQWLRVIVTQCNNQDIFQSWKLVFLRAHRIGFNNIPFCLSLKYNNWKGHTGWK